MCLVSGRLAMSSNCMVIRGECDTVYEDLKMSACNRGHRTELVSYNRDRVIGLTTT